MVADDKCSSHSFSDPGWGCVIAEELLEHVLLRVPSWEIKMAPNDTSSDKTDDWDVDGSSQRLDGLERPRTVELAARLAWFFAHQSSQVSAPTLLEMDGAANKRNVVMLRLQKAEREALALTKPL
jgi:hypothetical protein